jgi:DNA-directed RNA polymerase subunit RPC12/RpoP
MAVDTFGPTAEDETSDRYAACPACGSRLTHLTARENVVRMGSRVLTAFSRVVSIAAHCQESS